MCTWVLLSITVDSVLLAEPARLLSACIHSRKQMAASSSNWIMRNAPSLEPFGLFALFGALTLFPAILMIRVLEPELVLPAFSILLFAEAAVAAIVARLIQAQEKPGSITWWDFAGAFTFMGCAAAIFGEPDQAALFFEEEAVARASSRL
jgi:hypothetical protein